MMNRKSALVAVLVMALLLASCATSPETVDEPPVSELPPAAGPAGSSLSSAPTPAAGNEQAVIVDHTATDLGQGPPQWLEQAKQDVVWIYGSTSHGTQVWTGAEYLVKQIDAQAYCFAREWWEPPAQGDPACLRMGYLDDWSWDPGSFLDTAREMLDNALIPMGSTAGSRDRPCGGCLLASPAGMEFRSWDWRDALLSRGS